MSPYSYGERLVRCHPQSSLLVKDQPGPDLQLIKNQPMLGIIQDQANQSIGHLQGKQSKLPLNRVMVLPCKVQVEKNLNLKTFKAISIVDQ